MKKFLDYSKLIADILFFLLWTELAISSNSENLIGKAILILISLIALALLKSCTFDEEIKKVKFKVKKFIKLFFTENLVKYAVIVTFMLWYKKFISGLDCLWIVLSSFVVIILLKVLYYWLLKQKKFKKLTQ